MEGLLRTFSFNCNSYELYLVLYSPVIVLGSIELGYLTIVVCVFFVLPLSH
jgi:hypothetical protein